MRRGYKQLGYGLSIVFSVALSIIGFPFTVKYASTQVPFLGSYQIHSITFLGSPIYTWSTWNGAVGGIDFFVAFILNTLVCFFSFYLLTKYMG